MKVNELSKGSILLNDYHQEESRKACLSVEEMQKESYTLDEMREQARKISTDKSINLEIEKNNSETLSFMKGNDIDKAIYQSLFKEIEGSVTAVDLEKIAKRYDLKIDYKKYPRLDFQISKDEIVKLFEQEKISIDESSYLSFNQKDLDPLAKLLYSIIWKQGDLQKLRHIIDGIQDMDNIKEDKDDALVFYYFGNHLANKGRYPIIDQHVIRAFKVFDNPKASAETRKRDKIVNTDRSEYLKWINLKFKDRDSEFMYLLDKLIFEIGKKIKLKK
jgi:hypothetical protein